MQALRLHRFFRRRFMLVAEIEHGGADLKQDLALLHEVA
jgi:hypothetical protein